MIQAFVTGNIGKEAETRQAGKGTVTSFSVASNKKVRGEETVTWIRCSIWDKRGESLQQYLTKGSKVAVSGELSTREHDGKTYLELRVSEIDLMGGKRSGGSKPEPTRDEEPRGESSDSDDSIPF